MAGPLYAAHSRALAVLHSEVESFALDQREVFVGTAGSVIERSNAAGFRFYAHQFYDGDGKKRERYVGGPTDDERAKAAAEALRTRISDLKALVPSLRLLGREGFSVVDPRTYATVATLHNHGIFSAGGMLIGSHAYGILLNRLAARAAAYATEDIDIARREALAFETPPAEGLLGILRASGIEFVEVPRLARGAPSTSFMKYLLEEAQTGVLMAREGCCTVRLPLPERFAIHKLLVSRLRVGRGGKSDKDVLQACVLCAVLADGHAGALESALAAVPRKARKYLGPALEAARRHLEADHPRAWEELTNGIR